MKNLRRKLKEEYSFIEIAVGESFIKSWNLSTKAVLLTFNLQEQPYNIYIPGQPSDTAVYKYQEQPMICHNCDKYGHTKARCRQKTVCRNCGKDDHISDKTYKGSNELKCANCGEEHMAGNNDYEMKKKIKSN